MNDHSGARGPHAADPHPTLLRATALVAVIIGVLLLAAAAFVLSYAGIHQIALAAGVNPALARLYPLIFDAMLVIAFAAALTLRGAGWWTRCFVWLSTLLLLAAVAAADAVPAMGVALPKRPAAAAAAVIPWTLLLLAFWFWLAMLRQFRRSRAAAPAASTGGGRAANGSQPPRLGLDSLLEPRPGAAAPSLGDRVAAAAPQPVLPGSAATRPIALPAASPQSPPRQLPPPPQPGLDADRTAAGPDAADAALDGDAGLDDDYGDHPLVEEAAGFGDPAAGSGNPDDPAADYGDPDDVPTGYRDPDDVTTGDGEPDEAAGDGGPAAAGPAAVGADHEQGGQPGTETGTGGGDGNGPTRAEFGPPLTSQPLSAPPPAQFERPRSSPTPPQE